MKKIIILAVTALLGAPSPSYGMWNTITSAFTAHKYYTPWGEPCAEPWPDENWSEFLNEPEKVEIKQEEKPHIHKEREKEIVTIIKNTRLTSQEKIDAVQYQIKQGAYINETIDDKSLLFYAIEALDLELVKSFIETFKADYKITITLPLSDINHDIKPNSFQDYMVDSYAKTLVPCKKTHDFTILEFAMNKEAESKSNDYSIYHYLFTLPDIQFSRDALHVMRASSIAIIKKFISQHPDYPRMLIPLNDRISHKILYCLQKNIIQPSDVLGSITILLNSGLCDFTYLLDKYFDALVTTITDLNAYQQDIDTIFMLIDTHAILKSEEKIKLMNHKIFDITRSKLIMNKENLKIACRYAQDGDFILAKTLAHHTKEIKPGAVPLPEILELVQLALQHQQNNFLIDLLNNLPLSDQDIRGFVKTYAKIYKEITENLTKLKKNYELAASKNRSLLKPVNLDNVIEAYNKQVHLMQNLQQLLTITLYHKMPSQICTEIQTSNALPEIKNPTENETMLLGMIASLKKQVRFTDIEKILHLHGRKLIKKQEWAIPIRSGAYQCFTSMLLAQLWNMSPKNQPNRFLCESYCPPILLQERQPHISTNCNIIGPDIASHILQFTGSYVIEELKTEQKTPK